MIEQDATHAKI